MNRSRIRYIEYNVSFFEQDKRYWVASAWYLTRVIHPAGTVVTLAYEREQGKFINQMYASVYGYIKYKLISLDGFSSGCEGYTNGLYDFEQLITGKLIAPVYLTSITSDNFVVLFDRTPTRELRYPLYAYDYVWRNFRSGSAPPFFLPFLAPSGTNYPGCLANLEWEKLDRIRVLNKQNTIIKEYLLAYSDNPNNQNRDNERLTLLSLKERGNNNFNKPPYAFTYQDHTLLPGYLRLQSDHWGFFNNCARYANTNGYSAKINYQTHYADRESSTVPSVYLRGMLTRITYPTGGITQLEYSQNTYSQQLDVVRSRLQSPAPSSIQPTGGVRIRKITSWSPNGDAPRTQKLYYYINSTSLADTVSAPSSGVLGGQTQYYFDNYEALAYNAPSSWLFRKSVFSTQSVLPGCSNSHDSHIGYSQVIEKNADDGYKIYNFTNFDNGRFDEVASPQNILQTGMIPYVPYSSNEEQRGKLLKERSYNNLGQLVKMHEIDYTNIANGFIRAIKAFSYRPCDPDARIGEGTAYKLYTYSYFPLQEREIIYNGQGLNGVMTTKNYDYRNSKLLYLETTQDSKGRALSTRRKYADDFTFNTPVANSITEAVASMRVNARHMVGIPIETTTYRDGKAISASIQVFKAFNTKILPYQQFKLETNQPVTYTDLQFNNSTTVRDANLKLQATFPAYDARGNPLALIKEHGAPVSYVWGYNSTLPIAEVQNAPHNRVAHTSFEPDSPGGWTYGGWDGQPNYRLQASAAVTGQRGYRLDGGYGVGCENLPPGDYEISFWAKGGRDNVFIFVDFGRNGQELSWTQGPENAQGFRLIRSRCRIIQGSESNPTGKISLDAYGRIVDIDELRLQPLGAQMKTYTHSTGIGVTTVSDVNSQPTYYEYDGLQRLQMIKDWRGNIVKHLEYRYQQ